MTIKKKSCLRLLSSVQNTVTVPSSPQYFIKKSTVRFLNTNNNNNNNNSVIMGTGKMIIARGLQTDVLRHYNAPSTVFILRSLDRLLRRGRTRNCRACN
jgi:hypothetical protein